MDIRQLLLQHRAAILAVMERDGFYYQRQRRHDPTTWDINNGYCEEFAEAVLTDLPDGYAAWLDELPEFVGIDSHDLPAHYVLVFDNRYYDAECIDGVDNPRDLPIFQRRPRP